MKYFFWMFLLLWPYAAFGNEPEADCAQFGFNATDISPDIEILEYRYGSSGIKGTYTVPGEHVPQSMGVTEGRLKGDRLFVSWRHKDSDQIYTEDVQLKGHLPPYDKACEIYFAIKRDKLYVFLLTNIIMPKGSPGVDRNPNPIVTDYVKVHIIYPYGKLQVD